MSDPGAADERDLLGRLRAGDRAAFATLVARHGGALLRLATTFTKDRSLAEEVVQDALAAALDNLGHECIEMIPHRRVLPGPAPRSGRWPRPPKTAAAVSAFGELRA